MFIFLHFLLCPSLQYERTIWGSQEKIMFEIKMSRGSWLKCKIGRELDSKSVMNFSRKSGEM